MLVIALGNKVGKDPFSRLRRRWRRLQDGWSGREGWEGRARLLGLTARCHGSDPKCEAVVAIVKGQKALFS